MSVRRTAPTLSVDVIARRIVMVRGQRVMLASDLAELYEVETKNLNLAVRRNIHRFPADFMLQLTQSEYKALRLQIAALETGKGQHPKYLARQLKALESKYDRQFKIVFDAIRKLMAEPQNKRRPIGFTTDA